MNFANIRNNEIIDFNSQYLDEDIIRVVTTEDIYLMYQQDKNKVIYKDGEIILNPNYEEQKKEEEQRRIGKLTVTKRVFALALQHYGITYTQLKELIATNEQAELEWDLCVELERSNPLLDIMAGQLGVTPKQLDYIFQKANGEDI